MSEPIWELPIRLPILLRIYNWPPSLQIAAARARVVTRSVLLFLVVTRSADGPDVERESLANWPFVRQHRYLKIELLPHLGSEIKSPRRGENTPLPFPHVREVEVERERLAVWACVLKLPLLKSSVCDGWSLESHP